MAKKDSFILYTEQKAVIDKLTDEQAGKLIKAIYGYVENGEMPKLDNILDLVITPFKTILDKDKAKYEEVSKARAEAGSRNKKTNENKSEQKQTKETNENKTKQKKQMKTNENKINNCDDNEYDNDNDIKKENIKKKYGEYENVKFTDEEFEKVKAYFPKDYMRRIQSLDDYIQQTGKKYKDFVATLKNWARKEGYKPPLLDQKQNEELKEIDTSQLTPEEYDLLVKKKITIQDLIKKGRINV